MTNNLKVLITSLTVLLLIISLVGCDLFGKSEEDSTWKLLPVDPNGHFKEDIVYTSDSKKETYKSDGTYEEITYELVNGKKEIKRGYQKTYSWDTESMLLKRNITKKYNTTTKSWDDFEDTNDGPLGHTIAFFETQYANAYVWNESTQSWSNTFIDYNKNGVKEIEMTISYKIDLDKNKISYTDVYTDYDTDGNIISSTKISVEGSIDSTFPNGVDLKKGNQLTLHYLETLNTNQTYNASTKSWSTPENNTLIIDSFSFLHMGDFLYTPEIESSRGL